MSRGVKPLLSDPGFQVVRCLHLAKGTLDGNLPTADHADEYLVSCDLHGPASRFAQPSRLGERPQDDVCVEQDHQFVPRESVKAGPSSTYFWLLMAENAAFVDIGGTFVDDLEVCEGSAATNVQRPSAVHNQFG